MQASWAPITLPASPFPVAPGGLQTVPTTALHAHPTPQPISPRGIPSTLACI